MKNGTDRLVKLWLNCGFLEKFLIIGRKYQKMIDSMTHVGHGEQWIGRNEHSIGRHRPQGKA